jgi:hypothetical protein
MKTQIYIFILAQLYSAIAYAGGLKEANGAISGGGGKSVVCRDSAGAITSVELLDIWEAKTLYENLPVTVSGDLSHDVDLALTRLKNTYRFDGTGSLGDDKQYVGQDFVLALLRQKASNFLTPKDNVLRLRGVSLSLTDDSYELARPSGCEIQQVVNYQMSGRILINQDLYDHLDAINKAALIAHEAMYATLRNFADESNSIRTRRAIGFVFAGNEFSSEEQAVPDGALLCSSTDTPYPQNRIFFYPAGAPEGIIQKIAVSPWLLGGSKLIGVSHSELMVGFPINQVEDIMHGHCSEAFNGMDFNSQLDGPVEFDRNVRLSWVCQGETLSLYLTQLSPGSSVPSKSELRCRPAGKTR